MEPQYDDMYFLSFITFLCILLQLKIILICSFNLLIHIKKVLPLPNKILSKFYFSATVKRTDCTVHSSFLFTLQVPRVNIRIIPRTTVFVVLRLENIKQI